MHNHPHHTPLLSPHPSQPPAPTQPSNTAFSLSPGQPHPHTVAIPSALACCHSLFSDSSLHSFLHLCVYQRLLYSVRPSVLPPINHVSTPLIHCTPLYITIIFYTLTPINFSAPTQYTNPASLHRFYRQNNTIPPQAAPTHMQTP